MIAPSDAFSALPAGLKKALLDEYASIVQHYLERRWTPAELSAGKFCEVVFTILDGFAKGAFDANPSKPTDFVTACRSLESNSAVPRSFQILIPRLLPALYEVRNSRGVGHVGGDVDSNSMDSAAVLAMSSWIMAELVRVLHKLDVETAQRIVDSLAERRVPLVWVAGSTKRVLNPTLSLREHVLLLLASEPGNVSVGDLQSWCDYADGGYFKRLLRTMHRERLVEFSQDSKQVQLLPPGSIETEKLVLRAR